VPSKPLIVAALGARGTGKSLWLREQLARSRPPRLVVWDLMQEHEGQAFDKLGDLVRAMQGKSWRLAFHPSRDDARRAAQFELFCAAVLHAGRCTVVVEELAFVTTAHKAPKSWRECCLLGRHEKHRLTIYGTSQRPAQVDKEFFGNLDLVHVGRLANRPDAQKAAELLAVRPEEVQQLPDLAWIERRVSDVAARRGEISLPGAKAVSAPALKRVSKARNSTAGE
jgi:hypothetical protein